MNKCIHCNVPFSSVLLIISTDDTVPKVLKRSLQKSIVNHPSNATITWTELNKDMMQNTNVGEFYVAIIHY